MPTGTRRIVANACWMDRVVVVDVAVSLPLFSSVASSGCPLLPSEKVANLSTVNTEGLAPSPIVAFDRDDVCEEICPMPNVFDKNASS